MLNLLFSLLNYTNIHTYIYLYCIFYQRLHLLQGISAFCYQIILINLNDFIVLLLQRKDVGPHIKGISFSFKQPAKGKGIYKRKINLLYEDIDQP